jgi:hypothetical protein
MEKKERPLYVPPSRRDPPTQASSSQKASPVAKQKLEVKLTKKEKIVHAWEKEEPIKEKIVHAWEKEEPIKEKSVHNDNQAVFKLPSKSNKDSDDQLIKRGKNSQRIHRKGKKSLKTPQQQEQNNLEIRIKAQEPLSQNNSGPNVTFVSAKEYLAEMATSDWNDLEEIDYSKVPKWNP